MLGCTPGTQHRAANFQGKWKRGAAKAAQSSGSQSWLCTSQGKCRTWLKPRNDNQDKPHAQTAAAFHPAWLGFRRRDEDALPGFLLCRGAVGTAGMLGHSAPSVSFAGLGPWIKQNTHRTAMITRQPFSAAFNPW